MKVFGEYITEVKDTLEVFSDVSRIQKLGLAMMTIMIVRDEKRMIALPLVDSPVSGLTVDEFADQELEKELEEILP